MSKYTTRERCSNCHSYLTFDEAHSTVCPHCGAGNKFTSFPNTYLEAGKWHRQGWLPFWPFASWHWIPKGKEAR